MGRAARCLTTEATCCGPVEGPSNRLLASIDRWVGAVLTDDGIDMPLMGQGMRQLRPCSPVLKAWWPERPPWITCCKSGAEVRVSWSASDGRQVGNGDEIGRFTGPADVLLAIERSVLNLLGQLSGIATGSDVGHGCSGTGGLHQKTVYGLLDKWAVHLGGCLTHRLNDKTR